MPDDLEDLSLSRTFKMVEGRLAFDDTFEKILNAGKRSDSPKHSARLLDTVVDSKYQVLSLLGEGGMGAVYRARHLLLNKEVALKTFRTASLSPDSWRRFQREAQSIGKLTHANIVQVFDFGIGEQNFPYYTMELLVGESLADRLAREGRLQAEEALPIFIAVAEGMAHAHRLGIVHRDIKPANIFLERSKGKGNAKIVDFGLAKLATSQSLDSQGMTTQGLVFGSPLYMSPEQCDGLETDQRTDIYSFGCSLFQALTGTPPFVGKTALETIFMHQETVPLRLGQAAPGVIFPERLEELVAKLLAKDAKDRYKTFESVGKRLSLIHLSKVEIKIPAPAGDKKSRAKSAANGNVGSVSHSNQESSQGSVTVQSEDKESWQQLLGARGRLLLLTAAVLAFIGLSLIALMVHPRSEPGSAVEFFSQKTAKGATVFTFPAGQGSVGEWSLDGKTFAPASKPIQVPVGQTFFFTPGRLFADYPNLFRGFRPDDLYGLTLSRKLDWGQQHFDEIGRLKMLRQLNFSGCRYGLVGIKFINMLPHLLRLNVNETGLDGSQLAKLSCLGQLKYLDANNLDQMGPALDKLQTNKVIQFLSMKECELTDGDLRKIANLRSLRQLVINVNGETIDGVKALLAIPELEQLQILGSDFGPEIVSVLSGFKKLSIVHISTDKWSPEEIARLKKSLPKTCKIETN